MNKKRRKIKQNRPQSSHYINIPQPQNSIEKFQNILNKRFGSEFISHKHAQNIEGQIKSDLYPQHQNKSYNYDNLKGRKYNTEPDLTEDKIVIK